MTIKATGNNEILVNTGTEGNRGLPSVALLADGGWIVTWHANVQDNGSRGVYQQRFDGTGHAVGVETRVNTTTDGLQGDPTATALDDGGWVVAYASESADGDGFGVFQQRYGADGVAAGAETLVNIVTTGYQLAPRITALDDGGWLAAWMSDGIDGNGSAAVIRRYDAAGSAMGAETVVNSFTTGTQYLDSVTTLQDGGWVVTWSSDQETDESKGIYQQRYDEDGLAVGGEVHVNTHITEMQEVSAVTALVDGGWVVTWQSSGGQDGDSYGIFQQQFDDAGAKVGDETQVNTSFGGFQGSPSVMSLADGGWVVAWSSSSQNGIYQQRYDADGVEVGEETQVNVAGGFHNSPNIIAFEDGSWLVTWSSITGDTSVGSIHQRYFAADIEGSDEAETLTGTLWDERVTGFAGEDELLGGKGHDVLVGGEDADTFIFNKGDTGKTRALADTIEDFTRTQHDEIDLSAIDANTKRGKNNAFDFIGTDDFSRTAGGLRYEKKGDDTYIYSDMNGDRKADLVIHLDGALKLRAGDFDL